MNVCADFWDACSVPFVLASTCMQLHAGICVSLGVWVHLCVYGRLCVCIYVGSEGNFRCLSSGLSTFLLFLLLGVFYCLEGLILVRNLPSKLGCLISSPSNTPISTSLTHSRCRFLTWVLETNYNDELLPHPHTVLISVALLCILESGNMMSPTLFFLETALAIRHCRVSPVYVVRIVIWISWNLPTAWSLWIFSLHSPGTAM